MRALTVLVATHRYLVAVAAVNLLVLSGCSDGSTEPERDGAIPKPNMAYFFDLLDGVGDATVRSAELSTADNGQGLAAAVEGVGCFEADETTIECPNFGVGFDHFNIPLRDWLGGVNVLHGEIVHVGQYCPGLDPEPASPAGKIALIERGACFFASKIQRAYDAGAIGAIVYNSADGGEVLTQMVAPVEVFGFNSMPIPAVFVARSTGLTLAAGSSVAVKIQGASFQVLREAVQGLIDDGVLTKRQASPLKDALSDASDAVEAGDFAASIGFLVAFQDEAINLHFIDEVISFDELLALFFGSGRIIGKLQPAVGPVI